MIPRIIHFIWLGTAEMPQLMKDCMESWHKYLPNYEIMRWDDDSIKEIEYPFVQEALQQRKWAFASDVIRLYAINKYGGIYMDTDVMVYQSFDPLLHHHAFIGRENSMHMFGKSTVNYLTTCCFGAEKGNPFIKRCLDYYEGRHFIHSTDETLPEDLRYDIKLNSEIFFRLAMQEGYQGSVLKNKLQTCKNEVLTIYPSHFFDATKITPETYTKHLAMGTWRENKKKQYTYTWSYKIKWRIVAIIEKILRKFNYTMIELK